MIDESSETISRESRGEILETVAVNVYFYVLVDPLDGKIKYFGRTVDPIQRLRHHIYESKTNNRNKKERWIVSLLRKNVRPTLRVVFVKACTPADASTTEKLFIKKLSKRFELKNQDDHGLGGSFSGKLVYQFSLETGERLGCYGNANQASIATGVKDCNILRCCKGENGYGSKTAGGYFWSFTNYKVYPHRYVRNWREVSIGKPVTGTFQDGTTKTFPSGRIAAKNTGVNYKHISAACNGKRPSAGGILWKFVH